MNHLGKIYGSKQSIGIIQSQVNRLGFKDVRVNIFVETGRQILTLEFRSDEESDVRKLFDVTKRLRLRAEHINVVGNTTMIRFVRLLAPEVERQVRAATKYIEERFASFDDPRFQNMFDAALSPEPKMVLVLPPHSQKNIPYKTQYKNTQIVSDGIFAKLKKLLRK